MVWPFWHLAGQFADRAATQPTRLYASPVSLAVGQAMSRSDVVSRLETDGYLATGGAAPGPGEFRSDAALVDAHLRAGPSSSGWKEARRVTIRFAGGRIAELSEAGREVDRLELEAPWLASLYGPERRERRPEALEDLPEHLTRAVLAAEDARFFDHQGFSVRGMARALWVNVRAGGVRQGGSTLTQQLVKNLFLTHERTVSRKLREIVLAVLVDTRYSKPAILGAYLNEIYWGQRHGANLMGVGAASNAYFGKEASRLTLCEAAVLAGMIQSPGRYDPGVHPEQATERRNWVLSRMEAQEWLTPERAARAREEPLCTGVGRSPLGGAFYFRDRVRAELAERFSIDNLADGGYSVMTTLDPRLQGLAEEAVAWGVEALEEGWEKGAERESPLQAALVAVDPSTGGLRAYVGGRDYRASQFDRASQARRQAGSAFKPVVYAAAFEAGWNPADLLADEPLTVRRAGSGDWQPRNDDGRFRGSVSARQALELSLNVPTARLALDVGLGEVADMAGRLGVPRRLQQVPSMALGALEVTPLELATVYTTLAGGGVRRPTHGVVAVLSPDGERLDGRSLAAPSPALPPEIAYLVTSSLEGVFDRGTAKVVRGWGMTDRLAGKTGTTNDRRDSWFGGYAPTLATLVWVGYDDNATTRLSGARAALPIWNRFMWRARPRGGYLPATAPDTVVSVAVDPLTGERAALRCPQVESEVFPADRVPESLCRLHAGAFERRQEWERDDGRRGRFRRWWDRVFRGRRSDDDPPN